jgi:hypothetical protein
MKQNIAILAFTASVLGLFCIFDVVPGVGSSLGSVMLVIGGSVLICQAIIAEGAASLAALCGLIQSALAVQASRCDGNSVRH